MSKRCMSANLKRSRRAALARQQGKRCAYCGLTRNLTLDHRTPICRGGSDALRNLALACYACNKQKGPMTEAEWVRWMAKHPRWRQQRRLELLLELFEELDAK